MSNTETIDPSIVGGLAMFFVGGMVFFLILFAIIYIFSAICLMKIAQKTGTPNGWFAWLPILNFVLMLQIAKKPVWWIAPILVLMFIPIVNVIVSIVMMILIGISIARQLKKPEWTGWIFFISPINLIVLGYWAFSKDEIEVSNTQATL